MARDQKDALKSAYRSLARRGHSRRELQAKLQRKKYTQQAVQAVLAELEAKRFLDDRLFAMNFARDRLERRRLGSGRVAQELKAKGITEEVIDETLGALYSEIDESALAQEALGKRILDVMKKSPTVSDRRRLSNFLRRRGFSYEAIRKTLKTDYEIG